MKSKLTAKVAATALILSLTTVGCKPTMQMAGPATASTRLPAEKQASLAYDAAQKAARDGDHDAAVAHAERAVEHAPRDTAYRMLLADLYLKQGRFASAEAAFSDALSLDPANRRAAMRLVLAEIAQGKTGAATLQLAELSQTMPAADIGLAYALAGQPQRAIELLEPAARETGADGRVRQNLALSYALAGDWQKARVTAAQDVAPGDLDRRMTEWARFAQPTSSYDQVASLLGVTPVSDPGQPTHLALNAPVEPQAYADAAPATLANATMPVETAEAAPAPEPVAPVEEPSYAAAVASLVDPVPAATPVAAVAPAPLPMIERLVPEASRPARKLPKPRKPAGTPSRYVVQIGAYRTPNMVAWAWSNAQRRYGLGTVGEPLSTSIDLPGKGRFYRLSVAGFDSQAEAAQLCRSIRARQGACFVRLNAGDRPTQWALNGTRRDA